MNSVQPVKTRDEKLLELLLPNMISMAELEFASNDILIACAGFEERAMGALGQMKADNKCHLVVINYEPHVENNRIDSMLDFYRKLAGENYVVLNYNREDPTGFGDFITSQLIKTDGRVFIDISAMSRLLIIQILTAFASIKELLIRSVILYSEASEYSPTKEDAQVALNKIEADPSYATPFLSSGVFDITIIPELSAVSTAVTQTRLLAFPSFDAHQLAALRSELQPYQIDFIEGNPPTESLAWRREIIAKMNHIDGVSDERRHAVSTLDYKETLRLLLEIYRENSFKGRLLIAPTGSKMQTVAVAIFRAFITDIQIVYPTPDKFVSPKSYTKGIGQMHALTLERFQEVY